MLCARRERWLTPTLDAFRSRGFKVEGMVGDVTAPAQVQAVVMAPTAFGQVGLLINSRGTGHDAAR